MSRIDELIAEHCPNGVEFKTLGEVGDFIRGNGLQKSDLTETGVGAIHYGQIHTHYGTWAAETKSFVSEALASKLRKALPRDLVIATTSEDDEAVAKAVAWVGNAEVAVSGDAYIYRHKLEPKYVAYFFQSELFQDQKKRHITGTKVRRISGDSLAKIRVPVPHLVVQREIVKVLDTFTKLEAELEAELEARRRQYQYYRDALLTFDERTDADASKQASKQIIRWMTLGEVAEIGTGSHDTQDAIEDGDYIFYARGREPLKLDQFDFDETAIITAGDGAGVGKVFHYAQGKYALHQRAYRIVPGELMESRFVYHCVASHFYAYIQKASVSSSVTSLRRPMFLNFPIPVPPLEEQARIVSILDKFDALVNDLSSGLPAEIKARRQQYEHYRDKLLSFPKLEEVAA